MTCGDEMRMLPNANLCPLSKPEYALVHFPLPPLDTLLILKIQLYRAATPAATPIAPTTHAPTVAAGPTPPVLVALAAASAPVMVEWS